MSYICKHSKACIRCYEAEHLMWKNRPSFSYFTRIWWRMGCRKCINIKTLDWAVRCSVCEMKTKKTLKHFSVNSRFQELLLLSTSIHFLILFPVGVTIVQKNSKKFCNILFNISSVIRQKGESRTCAYLEGKNCSFFEKFGVLCFLVTSVLRFALLRYHRRFTLFQYPFFQQIHLFTALFSFLPIFDKFWLENNFLVSLTSLFNCRVSSLFLLLLSSSYLTALKPTLGPLQRR